MRIVRFDEEMSVPSDERVGRFRTGPLVGDDSHVRVEVLHVAAGGSIHCAASTTPTLIAVLAGHAVVRHEAGNVRALPSGYGVCIDIDDRFEISSEDGFTGVQVVGTFELWATTVTRPIVVEAYDPNWREWFESLCALIWPAIEQTALRIDHVGSTSVPGLAAKPIIDMDIVVGSEEAVPVVIDQLATLGYRWRGDLGVVGRQAFTPPDDTRPSHHLYLVVENNRAHLDHWLMRDTLREDPQLRAEYGALKQHNAELADDDIDVYVAAKAAFVSEVLTKARAERGLPPVTYWNPNL